MQMRVINTYAPEFYLNNTIEKFSSYLTENIPCLHYEDQRVNVKETEDHTKPSSTLRGQSDEMLNQVVHTVNTYYFAIKTEQCRDTFHCLCNDAMPVRSRGFNGKGVSRIWRVWRGNDLAKPMVAFGVYGFKPFGIRNIWNELLRK
jgi:hypothetical protein